MSDGPHGAVPFDPFAAKCLIEGIDELDFLLSQSAHINAYEARRKAQDNS